MSLVSCSWNNSLAIDDMEAQRSELQQLRERGKIYCSAMCDAIDKRENMLARTEAFGIHYPNLLIPVEEANEWHAPGEHALPGAWFQTAVLSCRLPETMRLCTKRQASGLGPSSLFQILLFTCAVFIWYSYYTVLLAVVNSLFAKATTAAMDASDAIIEGAAGGIGHALCEGRLQARGSGDCPYELVGLVEHENIGSGECVASSKWRSNVTCL